MASNEQIKQLIRSGERARALSLLKVLLQLEPLRLASQSRWRNYSPAASDVSQPGLCANYLLHHVGVIEQAGFHREQAAQQFFPLRFFLE